MHRRILAVGLAALSVPSLAVPSAAVGQGRLSALERPVAAWGRAAVVSPARSAALGPGGLRLSPSTTPRPPSRWWWQAPASPPCMAWCGFVVYMGVQPVDTTAVLAPPPGDGMGAAIDGCATVALRMGSDVWRIDAALPALDAETPAALFAAITRKLTAGQQVALRAPDGTRAILPAGPGVTGLVVEPCGGLPSSRYP